MPAIAAPIIKTVGGLVSGAIGSKGARDAAGQQIDAGNQARGQTWEQFQQAQQGYNPWVQGGQMAAGDLQKLLAEGGALRQGFTFDPNSDPGYQFRLQQGQQALERSAAARGMNLSGAALKGANQYAQGLASQEYNNAYGRWANDQQNLYNRLMGLSQQGLGAQNSVNDWRRWATGQTGDIILGQGQAKAAGTMGSTNAWIKANDQAADAWSQYMSGGGGGFGFGGK